MCTICDALHPEAEACLYAPLTGGPKPDFATIPGTPGDDTLIGTAADDLLQGFAGNDRLDGGAGNDTMEGGSGNDTYVVDSLFDIVTEAAGQGNRDTVETALTTYTLAEEVERLTVVNASSALIYTMSGNLSDNIITGAAAARNILEGFGGDDRLIGGNRDDILFGSGGQDTLEGGDGNDELRGGVADDILRGGDGDDQMFGKSEDDLLEGGAGDDLLDGGGQADTMEGGTGNDTYVVDDENDVVTETANQGMDTVQTTLAAYALGNHLEHLTLLAAEGDPARSGTGNNRDNTITGALAAANTLAGQGGDDVITGGNTDDMLDGGKGGVTVGGTDKSELIGIGA